MGQWGRGYNNKHVRIVMRDLAGNMVHYMGFRGAMRHGRANPTHERTKVAKYITIKRCQSTTRECELFGAVVRQQRIGMLQEGNENHPVVHPVQTYLSDEKIENHVNHSPEIGYEVQAEHLWKSRLVYPGRKSAKP